MSNTIGTIVVDLLARTGSFETDINRSARLAEKRAKDIDAAISKAGAAISVALGVAGAAALAMAKNVVDGLDALNDVKDATGASIENISALEDVALRTGTTLDNVSGILVKFNGVLKEADGKNAVSQALKAIGLDAAELRREDPAEALRKTAVALAGYADDGNKARYVQELFGKSIREAAPFLNDLAEKTRLVGTVSAEEAANAEKFNKQIFDLQKNSLDAKRALVSDLLPGISRVIEEFNIGRKVAGSFLDAIITFGTINPFRTQQGNLKALRSEIEGLEGDRQRYQRAGSDTRAIDEALANSRKQYTYLKALQQRDALADVGDTSDAVSRKFLREAPKPSAPDASGFKSGSGAKKDNSAAQEAKAQLAQDLEDMKKSTAALTGAFDNDEKVLSAMRAASLISDADYYKKKRDIIIATGEVEDAGLQATIDRLRKEQATLSGKDAIDNRRKLNDAEAELRKSRADTATQLTTLNIESEASTKRLTTAMDDARVAAESFLDTTNRARAIELAGMGQGTKARDFSSAISQIEQTYEQKRQDLERDRRNGKFKDREDDYKKELDLIAEFQKKSIDSYREYYANLEQRQASFTLGASEAARNYFDESRNAFKQTEEAVTRAFGGMEDALVEFVKTGKLDVKSLVDSIISDFARIVIKQQITGPLAGLLSEALKGGGGGGALSGDADYLKLIGLSGSSGLGITGGSGNSGSSLFGSLGKWVSGLLGFADGGSPPVGKVSIVGERGPELFVPNTAGRIIPNHELGGTGQQVVVHINNTIGDVASMAQVMQAQQGTERRIAAEIARNRTRGGLLSA